MKLKIRHLAPYLPYALKCRWNNSDSKELVIGGIILSIIGIGAITYGKKRKK